MFFELSKKINRIVLGTLLFIGGCSTTKQVTIASDPQGAVVLVDGAAIGVTPVTKELTFGEQKAFEIVLKKEGYEEGKLTIEPTPPDKTMYQLKLKKVETAPIDLFSVEPQNTDKGIRFVVNRTPTLAAFELMERSPNVQSVTRVTANDDKNFQIGPPALSRVDLVYRAVVVDESGTVFSNIWRQSLVAGAVKTRVTYGKWLDMFPDVSSDGQYVVFSSNRLSPNPTLWRAKLLGGGGLTKLTQGLTADYEPSLTPEGQTVVYASVAPGTNDPQIWSVDIRGGLTTQLREGESPRVAPNSVKILFIRKDKATGYKQIWVMSIDGTEETLLTQSSDHDEIDPSWSPDSKWIVFASNEGRDPQKRNFDIWIMASDGTKRSQLTTNPSRDDSPVFEHTALTVYFRSNRGGTWNIWRFDLQTP